MKPRDQFLAAEMQACRRAGNERKIERNMRIAIVRDAAHARPVRFCILKPS
jgi:hypothetical protein